MSMQIKFTNYKEGLHNFVFETDAKELGIEYELEKVTQIVEIMKFGVMITPALAIDGEVKVSGKVVSADEIMEMLR